MNAPVTTPMAPYAARLEIDYPERLDRLTTLLRLIWIITGSSPVSPTTSVPTHRSAVTA